MSTNSEADEMMMCCASCGIAEKDDIKLKKCTACKSVRYCSVKCQRDHRPKHKKACKKRAAELRDEILFKQPESSHNGDCPICCLPQSLDESKSTMMPCCSKVICNGCNRASMTREEEESLDPKCPFCRQPQSKTDEEVEKKLMKRIEVNDPVAICTMGSRRYDEGKYANAVEYYTTAAELGDVGAHYLLSNMYDNGESVEKDEKKLIYHLEQAAIGGHPYARYNLGCVEIKNRRRERVTKHFIIAAKLGLDVALDALKAGYSKGLVSKEDFASALRGHQAAVDAAKSPQRDVAEAAVQR